VNVNAPVRRDLALVVLIERYFDRSNARRNAALNKSFRDGTFYTVTNFSRELAWLNASDEGNHGPKMHATADFAGARFNLSIDKFDDR
jgi:hypothetical protein